MTLLLRPRTERPSYAKTPSCISRARAPRIPMLRGAVVFKVCHLDWPVVFIARFHVSIILRKATRYKSQQIGQKHAFELRGESSPLLSTYTLHLSARQLALFTAI